MSEPGRGGAVRSGLGGWLSGGLEGVERERQAALAAGRQAYAEAIRTGQNVRARTENEVISLGRARLAQRAAMSQAPASGSEQSSKAIHDDPMQADAFVRAAANKATFGLADHLAAAGDAVATDAGSASIDDDGR